MRRRGKFYKGLIVSIVAFAISGLALAQVSTAAAQTFNNSGPGCSVADIFPSTTAFNINGSTASTVVRVSGPSSCRETVSLASWNAGPGRSGFVGQQFFSGRTFFNLPPGDHTLSIGVNNTCTFQVDVLLGRNLTSGSGNAMYSPAVLMGFSQVRGAACPATPAAPAAAPAAQPTQVSVCNGNTANANSGTAAQGGNCSTNTVVVQSSSGGSGGSGSQSAAVAASSSAATSGNNVNTNESANVQASQSSGAGVSPESAAASQTSADTTAAAPSSLVNTGPATAGEIAGLFVGATALGTLAHNLLRRHTRQIS